MNNVLLIIKAIKSGIPYLKLTIEEEKGICLKLVA